MVWAYKIMEEIKTLPELWIHMTSQHLLLRNYEMKQTTQKENQVVRAKKMKEEIKTLPELWIRMTSEHLLLRN